MALMAVAEARARVLDGAATLPAEYIPVAAAHGRVLATALAARRTQPPAAVSAMDGYAVRAADVATAPVTLKLIGQSAAGSVFEGEVHAGEAVRILTGGVLPAGADSIVIQENVRRDGDAVVVQQAERPSRFVRPAGLDFAEGDARLPRGRPLTVRDTALAAAMNHAVVPVYRRPRIAIFSTGDELRLAGSELKLGQVVSSNGMALAALARAEGAQAIDFGIVPDRLEDTVTAIRRARAWGADILVTSGGASVGDYDLVQPALAAEGLSLAFWRIAMRPGKPLMFGRLHDMRVLGMPGNPVSTYVCALLFLVPLIRQLSGRTDIDLPIEPAVLGRDLAANDEREDYLRSRLESHDGRLIATPLSVQDSSMMSALAAADCLVIRRPHEPAAKRGDPCTIVRLSL